MTKTVLTKKLPTGFTLDLLTETYFISKNKTFLSRNTVSLDFNTAVFYAPVYGLYKCQLDLFGFNFKIMFTFSERNIEFRTVKPLGNSLYSKSDYSNYAREDWEVFRLNGCFNVSEFLLNLSMEYYLLVCYISCIYIVPIFI